jgi:hypothetical protein
VTKYEEDGETWMEIVLSPKKKEKHKKQNFA